MIRFFKSFLKTKGCATSWRKEGGRFFCESKGCHHWSKKGCTIRKVTLTCDDTDCCFNSERGGLYGCSCMDVHLDGNGNCLSKKEQ